MTGAPWAGNHITRAHRHAGDDVPAPAMPPAGYWLTWGRWAVLALGLVLAVAAGILMERAASDQARTAFALIGRDKADDVRLRVSSYADVLYAMRGLFAGSEHVTREDFHRFAQALDLAERYPGLRLIAYAPLVAAEDRLNFQRAVRAEQLAQGPGGAEFTIWPDGAGADSLPVSYLEPFHRNRAAWGADLLADQRRLSAVERARDGGNIGTTTAVTSLAESGSPVKTTVLRLAIYRGGRVPAAASERRRLFDGVVSAVIQADELVRATFADDTLSQMRVRVSGMPVDAPPQLLYDSHPEDDALSGQRIAYAVDTQFAVGDEVWKFTIVPLSDPVGWVPKASVAGVVAAILIVSVLGSLLCQSVGVARRRNAELALLNREAALLAAFGEDLQLCATPHDAYQVMETQMASMFWNSAGALYRFDDAGSRATLAASWGKPEGVLQQFEPGACEAVRRDTTHAVAHGGDAITCRHFNGPAPDGYICIPVETLDQRIGLLHVQATHGARGHWLLDASTVALVRNVAQQWAMAMANLELRRKLAYQATHDELTGLRNRHYMAEWFEQELHRCAREQATIGVILFDIDHFKRINDNHGHEAGDAVLHALAELMQSQFRRSDVICRYGGEEILVLMPSASADGTRDKAQALLRLVAQLRVDYAGQTLGPVTVSAGIAIYPADGPTSEALLRAADLGLYAAKSAGRDTVRRVADSILSS